jgi:O-antigen/teichoic acid export membrane protein
MFGRGLIYAAVFALQSAALIVITPLTVRTLSKAQFGRFVTVSTLVALLMAVLGFGLGTAIQRLHAEDDSDFRATRGLLGVGMTMALCGTAVVDFTGPRWAHVLRVAPYDSTLRYGVWSAGLAAVALLMSYLFRSQDRLGAFLLVMIPLAIGSQLAGLAFIRWVQPTASAYLAGVCIGELFAVTLGLVVARPRLLWYRNRKVVLSALALSLPLIPSGIAYQSLNLGDRIVVQHLLGQFAVGRYQLAYNTSALIMLALMLLSVAWLPKIFAIKDVELRKAILAESRDEVYRLLTPLIIGVSLVAPIALDILAPSSYRTNRLLFVVSIVAISAIPFAAYLANSRLLIAFGKTHSLMWISPTAAAINVLLNIVLVPVWGLTASALATLIGYGVLACMTNISSRRVAKLEPTTSKTWIAVGCAVIASLVTVILPTSSLFLGIRLVASLICAGWTAAYLYTLIKGTSKPRHARGTWLGSKLRYSGKAETS